MESISSELNYSATVSNHSSVIYRNVSPQGSTSLSLSSGSLSGPVEFVLSSSAIRLAKSRLNFTVNVAAAVAGNNYLNANTTAFIGRMVIYDAATSNILMDVTNFEKYGQLITPMCTPATELASKAQATIIAPAASAGSIGTQLTALTSAFNPVEDLSKSNAIFTSTQIDSQGQVQPDGGVAIAAPINRLLGYSNQYNGKREFYNGAAIAANVLDVSLPLSAFKMTVASVDRVLYSPSSLIVQLYFNATDQFGFSTNTNSIITAITSLTTTSISNINMSLATEANLAIVSQVINKVMSGGGISLPIPYVSVVRQTLAQGAQHSWQIQLTAGYGKRILFIASAPFRPVGTGGTSYPTNDGTQMNNFHPRGTLTTYNSFLNNVPISNPAGYDCTKGTDFTIANKAFLERSCIQTSGEYVYSNWVHVDSWVGLRSLCDLDPTAIDGLDVSTQSATYQWQANWNTTTITTAGSSATWVNVIVGQKTANFTAQGVTVN